LSGSASLASVRLVAHSSTPIIEVAVLGVGGAAVGAEGGVGSGGSGVGAGRDVEEGCGWGVGAALGEEDGVAVEVAAAAGIGEVGFHPAEVADEADPVGVAVAGVGDAGAGGGAVGEGDGLDEVAGAGDGQVGGGRDGDLAAVFAAGEKGAGGNGEVDIIGVGRGGGGGGLGEGSGDSGDGGVAGGVGGVGGAEGLVAEVKVEVEALDLAVGNGEAPSAAAGLGGEDGGRFHGASGGLDDAAVGRFELATGRADDGEGVAEDVIGADGGGEAVGGNRAIADGEAEFATHGIIVDAGGVVADGKGEVAGVGEGAELAVVGIGLLEGVGDEGGENGESRDG